MGKTGTPKEEKPAGESPPSDHLKKLIPQVFDKKEEPEIKVSEEKPEEKVEEKTEDELTQTKAKLDAIQKERDDAQQKLQDLRARLTQEQQEKAELYRFHKQTLPKINKTFVEAWDESPEGAVEQKVRGHVEPVSQEIAKLKAEQALTAMRIKHKDFDEYLPKIAELGNQPEYAALTWHEKGLHALYKMVKADTLEGEVTKLRTSSEDKSRVFSEGGSTREVAKAKPKLTGAQLRVVEELGITPDQYLSRIS